MPRDTAYAHGGKIVCSGSQRPHFKASWKHAAKEIKLFGIGGKNGISAIGVL